MAAQRCREGISGMTGLFMVTLKKRSSGSSHGGEKRKAVFPRQNLVLSRILQQMGAFCHGWPHAPQKGASVVLTLRDLYPLAAPLGSVGAATSFGR